MLVKPLEAKARTDYCVDNLTDRIFPVAAFEELFANFFVIKPGMSHFTLKHICGKIAHSRLLQIQRIHHLGEGVEVAANHLSTGLQQAMHDTHKLLDVMEIVQHTALHEYHIESTTEFRQIDLQYIADLVIDLYSGSIALPGGETKIYPVITRFKIRPAAIRA